MKVDVSQETRLPQQFAARYHTVARNEWHLGYEQGRQWLKTAALPLLHQRWSGDLSCSFWMHRITQKFFGFFVAKRSFLALYLSRWGGGGKCDQIAKHPESGQNLVCMHLAHNWLQLAASEHCCALCQIHDVHRCGTAKQEYPHE